MARLTESNITKPERAAFRRLVEVLGFTPRVWFGRDNGNDALLDRVREQGVATVYAIAIGGNGQVAKKGVREFRLLIAPVPVPAKLANGTRPAAKPRHLHRTPRVSNKAQWRAHIAAGVKKSWEKRRAAAPAG